MCDETIISSGRRKFVGAMAFCSAFSLPVSRGLADQEPARGKRDPIEQPAQRNMAGFIRRTIDLAEISMKRGEGTRYGAVVVRDGVIIGEGRNRVFLLNDPTAHSEIDAIRDACRRAATQTLEGCEIYCSARPCPMCSSACYWARLDRIYVASSTRDAISIAPGYSTC